VRARRDDNASGPPEPGERVTGAITGRPVEQRLAGSISAAVLAAQRGAHVLRVHDVGATRDALAVLAAVEQPRKG
jgi:dihydropteroate synthase